MVQRNLHVSEPMISGAIPMAVVMLLWQVSRVLTGITCLNNILKFLVYLWPPNKASCQHFHPCSTQMTFMQFLYIFLRPGGGTTYHSRAPKDTTRLNTKLISSFLKRFQVFICCIFANPSGVKFVLWITHRVIISPLYNLFSSNW